MYTYIYITDIMLTHVPEVTRTTNVDLHANIYVSYMQIYNATKAGYWTGAIHVTLR